jgi:protease I
MVATMRDLAGMRVALVVAHAGFRDEEYFFPRQILERRGATVLTLSVRGGEAVGKLGGTARVDGLVAAAQGGDFDAVVFVGGPGVRAYVNRADCHALATSAAAAGKLVAAICAAGAILARAGLLTGRRATCYPTEAEELRQGGARYTGRTLERDGPFLTGDGPQSAVPFGAAIAEELARRARKHPGLARS